MGKINMIKLMSNPKYKGKHIAVVAGKVYTANTGEKMNKILDVVEKKHPHAIPMMTYIPKADLLIL